MLRRGLPRLSLGDSRCQRMGMLEHQRVVGSGDGRERAFGSQARQSASAPAEVGLGRVAQQAVDGNLERSDPLAREVAAVSVVHVPPARFGVGARRSAPLVREVVPSAPATSVAEDPAKERLERRDGPAKPPLELSTQEYAGE